MNVLFFLIGAWHWLLVIYVGKWYFVIVMSGTQLGSGQRMVFAVLATPCCHICGNFDKFKQYYVTYTIINFGMLIGNVQTSVLAVMLKLAGPCCHSHGLPESVPENRSSLTTNYRAGRPYHISVPNGPVNLAPMNPSRGIILETRDRLKFFSSLGQAEAMLSFHLTLLDVLNT